MNSQTYKGLPPLAGLCTFEEAAKPGMLIEECTRRLKRFHYAFKRLNEILTARITAEPIYELKMAFAHHAYLCAEHATAIRQRVSEMREPPLGLDEVPHPSLEVFFDEIRNAPTGELLVGIAVTLDMLVHDLDQYLWHTHGLTDRPSIRILRFASMEIDDMRSYYQRVPDEMLPEYYRRPMNEGQNPIGYPAGSWPVFLIELLRVSGGLDGTRPTSDEPIVRRYSTTPHTPSPIPQRDERFQDLWNQGVNAEAFLYSTEYPAKAKVPMMLFKRLREIDVPEMMASIVAETPGKPWAYYRDMSRQIWDEARHAMMGEVGFVALGIDWTKARITFNWSYRLNTECTPLERHGVLFFIEQGLMPRTGKRFEFEVANESGIPLAATIQDFDWADEVLHSQIGRNWYVSQFANLKEALDFGDKAWSKITSNWATVKEQGLTQHDNWWPEIYSQFCAAEGVEPDPKVLAFAETYEGKRADLKGVE